MIAETTEEILPEVFITDEMPTFNHNNICADIMEQILADKRFKPLPQLTLDVENGLTPDISVYLREKTKPNYARDIMRYPEMPILAIEIVSPSQNIQTILEKAEVLVNNSVNAVWTVEPFTNSIVVTTDKGEKRFQNEAIESEGIRVDCQKIFENGAN